MSLTLTASDFKALFEAMPGMYLVFDTELRIVAVNDAYAQATKLRREDILGASIFEVFPNNSAHPATFGVRDIEASLKRILIQRTGEAMAVQRHDIRKPDEDGGGFDQRFWNCFNSPVFAPDGSVAWIIHRVDDVTESMRITAEPAKQRNLTESLRESEERLRLVLDASWIGTSEIDVVNGAGQWNTIELRKSERRERERAAELAALFDAVPTPVFIAHDPECLHITGNRAADDLLRHPRGTEASLSAPEETKPRHFRPLKDGRQLSTDELPAQRAARGCAVEDFEFTLVFDDGTSREMLSYATPLWDDAGQPRGAINVLVDITELKRAQEALRDRNARLAAVLNAAADAIITIDDRGTIQSVNAAAVEMFGYSDTEMIGQNVKMLMPSPYFEQHDRYLSRYAETAEKQVIGVGREVVGRRNDGSTFPVELGVSEVEHLKLFTGILRDISQRKELEREVVEIASLEQRRIGQDLHDTLSQELAALNMTADDLSESLRTNPSDGAILVGRIIQGLRRSRQQLRAVMKGLLPVEIDDDGLTAALSDLAVRTEQTGTVTCIFDCPDPVVVGDNLIATHLFLIAQEAIHNAIKHAHARTIHVSVQAGEMLVLRVHDDGTGIPSPATENDRGLGLRIMRNRAAIISATLTIEPAQPTGTLLTCALPRKINEP